ncbi:MAG: hypothetical protein ACE5I2_05580 [Anaerolineae bacterium]
MSTVIRETMTETETVPIYLSLHVVATLNTTPADARRRVNRQVVTELGTGLIGRDPDLVIEGEQFFWRVPIVLSLPGLGDLGQVGHVDVDARTGEFLTDEATRDRIVQHARRLYYGATLPAE